MADHGRTATGRRSPDDVPAFDVHVLPIGPVAGYPDVEADREAARIVAVLDRLGGRAVDPTFPEDEIRSLNEVDDALARWSGERGDDGRPSALLWFGHGVQQRMGPVLLVPGSGGRTGNAAVTPDVIAHHVYAEQRRREDDDTRWTIIVIEACNSKNFVGEVQRKFLGGGAPEGRSLLLVGSGEAAAQGRLGTFGDVLVEYLDSLSSHDRVFTLNALRHRFRSQGLSAEIVGRETQVERRFELRDRVPLVGATTVADQRRRQLQFDRSPEVVPHPRAPAGTTALEVTHGFAGRAEDLAAVAEWIATAEGSAVLVVTGAPGAGKSALLGEVLHRSLPTTAVVVALPLTGGTPADVGRQLAAALGVRDDGGDRLKAVAHHLAGLVAVEDPDGGPATRTLIVADALDEARDPVQVASALRELTEIPGVRLLIGTRRTLSPSNAEEPTGRGGVDLLEVLGSKTGLARVRVLEPDPPAAREYTEAGVRRILDAHAVGDDDWREEVTRTVADAVEAHVRGGAWQFLQAALVVEEIEQKPAVLAADEASRAALARMLERDQKGLFTAAVARITDGLPTAVPLLRALAYAHGRGLPRADGVWEQAAAGVGGPDCPVDDQDLALFLSRAAAYVLVDGEDRRSVYRLAHRSYAEQLLVTSTPEERFGMLTALLDLADSQTGPGRGLSPHLAARLPEYTADSGARGWAALAARPAVVDRLPVPSLSALALTPGAGTGANPVDLPIEVLGTVASAHLIEASEPDDRPGLRQLGGLRAAGLPHEAGPDAAWRVCWGRLRRVPPHLQLGGTDGAVSALASHPAATWLVTGALDGTIVVWEPWLRHRPVTLLRESVRPVTALAASGGEEGDPAGLALLVAAHDDRAVHLWDVAEEPPKRRSTTSTELVRVMAALPGGSRRFVIGGEAGYLAVLDADGDRPVAAEPFSLADVTGVVAVDGGRGGPFVVTAHRSGELALWTVAGPAPALAHRLPTHRPLVALTVVADAPEGPLLATAGEDGLLRHWRVDGTGVLVAENGDEHPEPGVAGDDPVLTALPGPDGRGALVTGDRAGTLRVLRHGWPAEETSMGTKGVTAVGVLRGPQGGGVLAVTAERDSKVHFWDPSAVPGQAGERPVIVDLRRDLTADGFETLVVATKQGETVLRATDGEELADSAERHGTCPEQPTPNPLPDLADDPHTRIVDHVTLDNGFLATAGREGVVALWRDDGESAWRRIRVIRLGSPCVRLAALTGGKLAVATEDGVVVIDTGLGDGVDDSGEGEGGRG